MAASVGFHPNEDDPQALHLDFLSSDTCQTSLKHDKMKEILCGR